MTLPHVGSTSFPPLHVSCLKRFNVCALSTHRFGLVKDLSSFQFDKSFNPFVLSSMSDTDDRFQSNLSHILRECGAPLKMRPHVDSSTRPADCHRYYHLRRRKSNPNFKPYSKQNSRHHISDAVAQVVVARAINFIVARFSFRNILHIHFKTRRHYKLLVRI